MVLSGLDIGDLGFGIVPGGGGTSKQVSTMEPQELAMQLLLELVRAGNA